jgi:crotonobetainyl-CoA:carnitine CoA-transferase CaiB-like acyl-CoA transferase
MVAGHPLRGIRVLDFTANVSGPYATQLLVELGAQVVKVERPGGEDGRRLTPTRDGHSAVFEAVNRGKRSIVIDLKREAGRDLALRLAARVDVVVENLRPGGMAALGLGFAQVSAVNPSVVYLSVSGFGQHGPLASRPGYDMVMQARAGLISMTGEPDRVPVRVGVSIVDFGTGPWAALAVLAALRLRDQGAGPQHLDLSLFDVAVNWATLPLTQYTVAGQPPRRMGGQTAMGAPADIYPTARGHLVVAVVNEPLWARFCRAAGLTHLMTDPRFLTNALRSRHRAELSALLVAHFATDTAAAWARRLQAAGVTAEEVADVESLLDDPQAAARSHLVEVDHPALGRVVAGVAPPVGNRAWRAAGRAPAPGPGEHSRRVLDEFGVDPAEADRLLRDGTVQEP